MLVKRMTTPLRRIKMHNNTKKTKKSFKLAFVALLIAVLTLCLSGCGRDSLSLEGLYVATFKLGGGTLETPTSSVKSEINFAYHPGTYVLDPLALNGYVITRPEYEFTGWYTSEDCSESSKWDFENSVIDTEKLVLYAGWQKAIKLTYTLYYTDEATGKAVALDSYRVKSGDKFDDWKKFADTRKGYTSIGYFSDPECTIPWDKAYTHPGVDADLDVPVYVGYMAGEWTFVDSLTSLQSAISAGKNIHLTADIDCGGATVSFGSYAGEFNGNGHTISNFKVIKSGTINVSCSIFERLEKGAIIRDVSFTGVTYDVTGIKSSMKKMKVAALAVSADSITISNVKITGEILTNYDGEIPTAGEFVFENIASDTVITVTGDSAVSVSIVKE